MKKQILYISFVIPFIIACQKQKVWEFKILPNNCYAEAFYIKPDFQPRSFTLEMTGALNQDVMVFVSGTQPSTDIPNERFVGLRSVKTLKRGTLNFSDSAEIYVEDLKIIIVGSDTSLHPVPEKDSQDEKCWPLGDIKVKVTLK